GLRRPIALVLLALSAGVLARSQPVAAGPVSPDHSPPTADLPRGPLHPAGRWIKDATGRIVIIHGLELARKTPPYHAPAASFTAQDAQNIQDWGFDAVRLAWFWKGLDPQ